MSTKTGKEARAPGSNPGELSHVRDTITIDSEDKRVSPQAITSVASQYGISATLFKEWLVGRGFEILDEA